MRSCRCENFGGREVVEITHGSDEGEGGVESWPSDPLPRSASLMKRDFIVYVICLFVLFYKFSHILERGAKKGVTHDDRSKEMDHVAPSKHSTSPVDEKKRVEEFERRLRFAMEQSLYLQAQHLSAMDKFEKDLTKATEDSLLTHALHKSRLEETDANKKSKVPLKGILKKPRGYVLKTDMVTAWKANVNFFLFVGKYGLDTDLSHKRFYFLISAIYNIEAA